MDNFDLKKFLVENKLTVNSKLQNSLINVKWYHLSQYPLTDVHSDWGIHLGTLTQAADRGLYMISDMGEDLPYYLQEVELFKTDSYPEVLSDADLEDEGDTLLQTYSVVLYKNDHEGTVKDVEGRVKEHMKGVKLSIPNISVYTLRSNISVVGTVKINSREELLGLL